MDVKLDDEQRRAVEYDGGPLLIVAGPGSGKTRVLTERVWHLVSTGRAKAEEVLCLTFTEKAAGEMGRRLERHGLDTANMDMGTFHSFALKILEDNELDTGLDTRGGVIKKAEAVVWAINNIDRFGLESVEIGNNAAGVMESIMDGISSFARELKTPDDIDRYIGEQPPGDGEEGGEDELRSLADLSRVYRAYQEFKREMRVVDYDDMVAGAVALFKAKPAVLRRYRDKYKHVLVDELQDNNVAQFQLAKLLAGNGSITAVGDEDQSIYSFQGSYRSIFDGFRAAFEGTHQAQLTTNYRSTENIVRVTNDWMGGRAGASQKRLHSAGGEAGEKITLAECSDDGAEAEYVAEKIAEMAGLPSDARGPGRIPYREIAVLARRKIDGEKFEAALVERGIPAKYSGSADLLYEPIVRDLMAHVKTAAEPATSGAEIAQMMRLHGISERNVARINRAAHTRMFGGGSGEGDCVLATIRGEDGERRPKTTQEAEMREFQAKLDRLVEIGRGSTPVDKAVYKIAAPISGLYRKAVLDDTRQGRKEVWQLNEICRIAASYARLYRDATLGGFVKHLYQMGEQEGEPRDSLAAENAVEITTIHQSKGREFEAVFVADASARRLPIAYRRKKFGVPEGMSAQGEAGGEAAKKELHLREERRLLYVAMTRAKSRLFITHAKRHEGGSGESRPSVFLGKDELDAADNPRMAAVPYEGKGGRGEAAGGQGVVERLARSMQEKAIVAVGGMSLGTAVGRIIDLSRIKYYGEHGSLDGFDPESVLAAARGGEGGDREAEMGAELGASRMPLLDAGSFEFSASKIDLYKRCPLQFKFRYVLHVPGRPSAPSDVGAAVHSVLEQIAKRRMNGEATTEEQALELLDRRWKYAAFASRKNAGEALDDARSMIRRFIEWDGAASARGAQIAGVEQKFGLEVDGLRFIGKMDRVDREPDGRYVVTDYKTGKSETKASEIGGDVQMNLYALAAESIYGSLPYKAMQLFVRSGREVPNMVSSRALSEQRDLIVEKARAILAEQFPASPGYAKCRWCDYVEMCDDRHPGSQKRR